MKSQRRNFNTYYEVREGKLKRLHTVWSQLYDNSGEGKTMETVKMSVVASD